MFVIDTIASSTSCLLIVDTAGSIPKAKHAHNTHCFVSVDPIAHVSQAFRGHLLRYALSAIVLPSATDDDAGGDQSARDALRFLHMLNECACDDQVTKWWVAVGMVAVNWLRGEDEAAERYYSTVESVPKSLWNAE